MKQEWTNDKLSDHWILSDELERNLIHDRSGVVFGCKQKLIDLGKSGFQSYVCTGQAGGTTVPQDRIKRRLAAVLALDIVGYSRLMGKDETGTRADRDPRYNRQTGRVGA
jgi:hypothetical protein